MPDLTALLYLHLDRKIGGRELDCLTLVHLQGCTMRETARRLGISLMQVQRSLRRVVNNSRLLPHKPA